MVCVCTISQHCQILISCKIPSVLPFPTSHILSGLLLLVYPLVWEVKSKKIEAYFAYVMDSGWYYTIFHNRLFYIIMRVFFFFFFAPALADGLSL